MKAVTILQAAALLALAMLGAYASAHEPKAEPPQLCVPALSQTDCTL
ncbi:hypothetical protein [Tropicibacter naphthalenivorans]|nr:hypothetical protein [Tropicibacter naphthalenivorans]